MMIDYARRGLSVIRLKSGDPLVFGRAGEEMDALRAGGIFFEVIPGITAAFAAAAALHRPLTDRRSASSIRFSSGHHADGSKLPPASLSAATRVVYMPGRDLAAIAAAIAQRRPRERSTLRHRLPRGPATAANCANDARAAGAHPCPSCALYPAGRRNAAGRANRRGRKDRRLRSRGRRIKAGFAGILRKRASCLSAPHRSRIRSRKNAGRLRCESSWSRRCRSVRRCPNPARR